MAEWLYLALAYAVKLYSESGYYREVVGVNLEAAIDPALLDTFPAGYRHMVDLLPGVMVGRDPGKTV